MEEGRGVRQPGREGRRESAAGIGDAEDDVDQGLGLLLTGEEGHEDRRCRLGVVGARPVHPDR